LIFAATIVVAAASLIAAGAIFVAQRNLSSVQRVDTQSSGRQTKAAAALVLESLTNGQDDATTVTDAVTSDTTGGVYVPPGTVKATNFLLTGSDSRGCIDPKSPYAGAFLSGGAYGGARSDTILILRVEPETGQAAMLSFPRDLWVPVAGTNRRAKINSTFDAKNPAELIATIQDFTGIHIDHYVNIDFCVFKDIVNAVGGISVPFSTPVRDFNTGLFIDNTGCYRFSGDSALAYVRSRHIQFKDPAQGWLSEGTSDIGRIRRQQDFIRRVMQKSRAKGVFDLSFVQKMVTSFEKRVTVDANLTADDILRLVSAMRSFNPNSTRSFIVEGGFGFQGTQAVINPNLTSSHMRQILAVFRGQAHLSQAPSAEVTSTGPSGSGPTPTTVAAGSTQTLTDNATTAYGASRSVVPDPNVTC
jgi:LCP family protein required for cell wall assembly